jgi:ketosteroid isomerase-like protein
MPESRSSNQGGRTDALDLVQLYFARLESGDFVGAADCFSETARYSHPPYVDDPPGTGRHEAHGRDEILALFRRRGLRSTHHELTATASQGDRTFISGTVQDPSGTAVGSFVSYAVFDQESGQFGEYVAYSSRPAVWAAYPGRDLG